MAYTKEKRREYDHKYREEHREKIKEQRRKYREENKEKLKEQQCKYREEHREEINERGRQYRKDNKERVRKAQRKYCENNRERLRELGRKHYQENIKQCRRRNNDYYNNNKDYFKEYYQKYYLEHKEENRISKKISRAKIIELYNEWQSTLVCADCGMSFENCPEVCDFHHIGEKYDTVSSVIRRHGLEVAKLEAEKCVPLCANCHRMRHMLTSGERRRRARFITRYKGFLSCSICGLRFKGREGCCDFHHLSDKIQTIGVMSTSSCSMESLKTEIRKCIPICANCHRTLHANE